MATLDDLLARSVRDQQTGCLRWTGAHTSKGYGQLRLGGKRVPVHRAAHEAWTHCTKGHEYTEANTIRVPRRGYLMRKCRSCFNEYRREQRRNRD